MPLLTILPDSEPIMRKTSRRIRHVDEETKRLVSDMYESMVEQYGVGLAAVQVGVLKRFFIYEIPKREMKGYEACYKPDRAEKADQAATGDQTASEASTDTSEETPPPSPPDYGYTGDYIVCINPKIISREGEFIDDEGCLSKEGWLAKVKRAIKVTFQAYDTNMKKFERTVEGLEARCVQHEIDHLDGILFTDRAEPGTLREITEEDLETEDREGVEAGETGSGQEPVSDQATEASVAENA
jgi:peptide deformylase